VAERSRALDGGVVGGGAPEAEGVGWWQGRALILGLRLETKFLRRGGGGVMETHPAVWVFDLVLHRWR
jgi:hypothetical protein